MQNNNHHSSKVTIDELAIMIANGFKESRQDLSDFKLQVANGFKESRQDLLEFKSEVSERFIKLEYRVSNIEENMATKDDIIRLEKRFDGLERVIFNDHGKRIRRIETKLQLA